MVCCIQQKRSLDTSSPWSAFFGSAHAFVFTLLFSSFTFLSFTLPAPQGARKAMTQPARVTAFSFCLCYRRPNHLNALRFTLGIFSGNLFFLLQTSQPCGAGLFAFSQKKLLLVQRVVAWDRLHSFYKNHRRRGRSAGPEAGRGVSSPPSLPLNSTHPATRNGLLAPFRPQSCWAPYKKSKSLR